jgi:N-methylhydantoinase A/oxoprolinase/acetone carboxylase beta subunit
MSAEVRKVFFNGADLAEKNEKIYVIACGVLSADLQRAAEKAEIRADFEFLESGLHENPAGLRRQIQQVIDRISSSGCSRIVIGYGICGLGTAGLLAKSVPLVIPQVHDCIAIFLGSDEAYRKQFKKCPGTYYFTAGWFEKNVEPDGQKFQIGFNPAQKCDASYSTQDAKIINDFFSSWRKNYTRAVFIDTAVSRAEGIEEYARNTAEKFGWKYEKIAGSTKLLEKMLTAEKSDDEVLFVPAGFGTIFDVSAGRLEAAQSIEGYQADGLERIEYFGQDSAETGDVRYGLGIDTGGTYTDVVIYDFLKEQVFAKNKALTTQWDFAVGIQEALAALDRRLLNKVTLVSVSTTLATNSIVEDSGVKVGLLLMPPYGLFEANEIGHNPTAAVSGRLDIDGKVLSDIIPQEVQRIAQQMIEEHKVRAFAVSGFAGTVNPEHELKVKQILRESFGLSVTCGHELSELLNFKTRAITAVLNARTIPLLEKFLGQMEKTLRTEGISAPIVVVKGDGSLVSVELARQRPVETILSGPAASVAAAKILTKLKNAIVVDIGGTTTDTAAIKDGFVKVCEDGTVVGSFKTHVKALDMRSTGLGGDSFIRAEQGKLKIGPQHVVPVCRLSANFAGTQEAISWLSGRSSNYRPDNSPIQLIALSGHRESVELTQQEREIIGAIEKRPRSLDELAAITGCEYIHLPLSRLIEHNMIIVSGLTPTDVLHIKGDFVRWDRYAARMFCELFCRLYSFDEQKFIEQVLNEVIGKLAAEILEKAITEHNVILNLPVIGIGAPAGYFVPRAAKLLKTEAVIPENADVASAIGAVTSRVMICRHIKVKPQQGLWRIEGLAGHDWFIDFKSANNCAVKEIVNLVRYLAKEAGTSCQKVEVKTRDSIIKTGFGTELFVERLITASLSGRCDMAHKRG